MQTKPFTVSDENRKDIGEFIIERTGAKSALVIVHPDEVPCQLEKMGIGCFNGHPYAMMAAGIEHQYVLGVLLGTAINFSKAHDIDVIHMLEELVAQLTEEENE